MNSSADRSQRKMTVLFVDDDPAALASFQRLTRDLPVSVRFASNATEALRMMEAEPAELVISDYRMPGLDGVAFLKQVRRRWMLSKVMCVLHTGDPLRGREPGFDVPVLAKPCDPDALRDLILSFARPS